MYFDEAVKGLEAQLKDLEKAQKFIFMEYHAIEDAEEMCIRDRLRDLERIKPGDFVLMTFNALCKYRRQIKKWLKIHSRKTCLVLDERCV